jgi:S1-C subfamily serine protease
MIDNPRKSVVPIMALDNEGNPSDFLGSAFFIDNPKILVTANHVLIEDVEKYAIIVMPDYDSPFYASVIKTDEKLDLAHLQVEGYFPENPFQLMDDQNEIALNDVVVCNDYGLSMKIGDKVTISPSVRMGNVSRILDNEQRFIYSGQTVLELSFPIFRGASGAPIFKNTDRRVVGVAQANVDYHKIAAQIARTFDARGEPVEEIEYMLPSGLALHVQHLKDFLG